MLRRSKKVKLNKSQSAPTKRELVRPMLVNIATGYLRKKNLT